MNFEIPPQKENSISPEIIGPQSKIPSTESPLDPGTADQKLKKAFAKNPRLPEFSEDTGFHRGPRNRFRGRKTLVWSFTAAVIDTLLFVAFTLGLAWLGLKITGVGFHVAGTSLTQGEWLGLLGSIFLGFSFCYMILLRLFLRATIGEWACGLEVRSNEIWKNNYVTQIFFRGFLICLSGYIFIPLLSLLTGKDLAGYFSKTQIQEV